MNAKKAKKLRKLFKVVDEVPVYEETVIYRRMPDESLRKLTGTRYHAKDSQISKYKAAKKNNIHI